MEISGEGMEAMSGAQLLDTADALARTITRAENQLLNVAYQFAIVHGPDTVDPEKATLPGRQTARRLGGQGTPEVASFAPAELGARMGRSTYAGEQLIADALDMRHRLPQLWARVRAGEVRASYARHVAKQTRDLDMAQAAYVDSRVVESADGRITWTRFMTVVDAAIVAADPAAAEAAEQKARTEQFARRTRNSVHGIGGFYVRAGIAGIARLDASVGYLAEAMAALGCTETLDARRAMAVVLLANPAHAVQFLAAYAAWKNRPHDPEPTPGAEEPESASDGSVDEETGTSGIVADAADLFRRSGGHTTGDAPVIDWADLLPGVTLFAHLYCGPDSTGVARIEGQGPVSEAYVRDVLGPDARITVQPVLDLANQAPVDAYEVPDRHRQAVRLMTPADAFPYATASVNQTGGWTNLQIDHTVPWPKGPSSIGNYGPLTLLHHMIKTHDHWQLQQPFPGIYLWRDPHGTLYLVDHTGTRQLRQDHAA